MDASQSSRSSATEGRLKYVSCIYLDLGQSGIFIDEKDDAEAGAVSCNRRGRAAPRPADLLRVERCAESACGEEYGRIPSQPCGFSLVRNEKEQAELHRLA